MKATITEQNQQTTAVTATLTKRLRQAPVKLTSRCLVTEMPGGGKRFHAILNGVHQLCIYREDVLIYAYSADGLDEINKILREIGFSEAE